jgi:hypothetical protein
VTFVTSYPDPVLLSGQVGDTSVGKTLTVDEAQRIATNIAKLPEQLTKQESPGAHDTGENSVRVTTRSSARTCLCIAKTREDAPLVSKVLMLCACLAGVAIAWKSPEVARALRHRRIFSPLLMDYIRGNNVASFGCDGGNISRLNAVSTTTAMSCETTWKSRSGSVRND